VHIFALDFKGPLFKSKSGILKTHSFRLICLVASMAAAVPMHAQSGGGGNLLVTVLAVTAILVTLFVLLQVADSLIQVEATKRGIDTTRNRLSIMPSWREIFGSKKADYTKDHTVVELTKGFDIKLKGESENRLEPVQVTRYAVQPHNYNGIAPIPKVVVEVGQEVKAGDQIFFDKSNPDIQYVAPVSGEVIEINRGAKRAITEVVILADKNQKYREHKAPNLENVEREALVQFLIGTGAWPYIVQRPYDLVPQTDLIPENIFVSTFSTAPLAVDRAFAIEGKEAEFHKGLEVLGKLTSGKVYLGLSANEETAPAAVFTDAPNAEKVYFRGPHPSGNVGVHIHHIAPITDKEIVWTVKVQDVAAIGSLFTKGYLDSSRTIALSGDCFEAPCYIKTNLGANVGELIKDRLSESHVRLISGDVLTGNKKGTDNYMDAGAEQLTVVKEGDYHEMFGWLLPIKPRPSISKTFPNFLMPNHEFKADTNTHGEERAFVVTGQYESVLPMDIFPQQLMKAILTQDLDLMEGLGIKELTEEDIALCEFVCTSKQPLQEILREGLEIMREQS
jgi:Na+-transporting NADH:ubiquinone oxidoreductase subunit A